MPFMRHIGAICTLGSILAGAILASTGCKYTENAAFIKDPVDVGPQGHSSTERGPAYGTALPTPIDSAGDWSMYNRSFTGTRFSPLAQITTANAASLRPACTFNLGTKAAMESSPVVIRGVMYVTTALSTFAVDAGTCQLRWSHMYEYYPEPAWDLKVNRGVAYMDTPNGPRLFRGSNDGRVYALDARTGEEVWNVKEGDVSLGETFPAAPVAWHGLVFIGNAGGDNYAVTGRMIALDARTGAQVWSFDLVPRSGPAAATWPAETDRVPRAGGTTWTSYALDTLSGTIYLPTGNAAPDFLYDARAGSDMYAYSVVALDAGTGALRHVYQLLHKDFHDWDMAAAPMLLATGGGRSLVIQAGKDGYLYGVDRASGQIAYKTQVTTRSNADVPLTKDGTHFCPGVQGGVEYNGPAYSPATNALYVGSVDWCTTAKVDPPASLKNKKGLPWTGAAGLMHPFGIMDPKTSWHGWLTAVDADNGTVKWRYVSATPMISGVTTTAGGLVFAADLNGNIMAFDAGSGAIRYHYNTGQPVGGGIASYAVNGKQFIAVASGLDAPLTWQTKTSAAKVVVFALP
ncbi:MAG: pyrroloquinoline quinone-dependent dehydrogenase [Gemmatimonadaceae bacterium]